MPIQLDTLKTFTREQLKRQIPDLAEFSIPALDGVLKLFQHQKFEELVKAWVIAGETDQDYRRYLELVKLVQKESNVSDVVLALVLKWYYYQSTNNDGIQPQ